MAWRVPGMAEQVLLLQCSSTCLGAVAVANFAHCIRLSVEQRRALGKPLTEPLNEPLTSSSLSRPFESASLVSEIAQSRPSTTPAPPGASWGRTGRIIWSSIVKRAVLRAPQTFNAERVADSEESSHKAVCPVGRVTLVRTLPLSVPRPERYLTLTALIVPGGQASRRQGSMAPPNVDYFWPYFERLARHVSEGQ